MATTTLPPPEPPGPGSPVDLSGDPRRHRRERTMGVVFFAAAGLSLVISALILVSLFSNGFEFFTDVEWSNVFNARGWNPRQGQYGISTILMGSIIVTGIGVGILSIPLVASVSEDAMRAVPNSLREASAGVGARRISTTVRVVLPAAVSGIVAALILAASRAIGETMVVFIAGGASDTATYTTDPLEGSLTMTAAMASLAVRTDNLRTRAGGELAEGSLSLVRLALFAFTFLLNVIGNRFVRRVRQAY